MQSATQEDFDMPIEPDNIDGEVFQSWLAEMGWNVHGGIGRAAEALGKSTMQIARYRDGANLGVDTRLAMSALADGLKPWGEEKTVASVSLRLTRPKRPKR